MMLLLFKDEYFCRSDKRSSTSNPEGAVAAKVKMRTYHRVTTSLEMRVRQARGARTAAEPAADGSDSRCFSY